MRFARFASTTPSFCSVVFGIRRLLYLFPKCTKQSFPLFVKRTNAAVLLFCIVNAERREICRIKPLSVQSVGVHSWQQWKVLQTCEERRAQVLHVTPSAVVTHGDDARFDVIRRRKAWKPVKRRPNKKALLSDTPSATDRTPSG